jgi:quercetin dioxygenase-like cupin family protein
MLCNPWLALLAGASASQPPDDARADLVSSRVLHLEAMPERLNANGSRSRNLFHGQLPTGEAVALHASEQPAGTVPNPAHRIEHTEFICLREGTVEFQHGGVTERASAGDVLFIPKGTLHGVRNVGSGPAAYVVFAIGGDVHHSH